MQQHSVNIKTLSFGYKAPCGIVEIEESDAGIVSMVWNNDIKASMPTFPSGQTLVKELDLYFANKIRTFSVPLHFTSGTVFQQKVWKALETIPFGKTASYKDIAEKVESPKAVRAVGNANSKNPFCIIVPCHRVVQHNGSLGGYAGGLAVKQFLLELEQKA